MKEPDGAGSTRIDSAERALRADRHGAARAASTWACGSTATACPAPTRPPPARTPSSSCRSAPLDRDLLARTVDRLEPLGETPIGLSLQQAAADLPDGVPGTVILVSDGEDECFPDLGPEPCAVTRDLVAQGVDLRLETIGLQVEPAGAEQLRCMAEAGGGEFTSVEDAGLLAEAIAAAQNRSLRTFEVRGEPGERRPVAHRRDPAGARDVHRQHPRRGDAVVRGRRPRGRRGHRPLDHPDRRRAHRRRARPGVVGRRDRAGRPSRRGTASPRGQATTLALSTGPADGSRSPFGAVRAPGRVLPVPAHGRLPGRGSTTRSSSRSSTAPSPSAEASRRRPAERRRAVARPVRGRPTARSAEQRAPRADVDLPAAPGRGRRGRACSSLLLALAVAAGGGLLWWRRRRAARDGPPPRRPTTEGSAGRPPQLDRDAAAQPPAGERAGRGLERRAHPARASRPARTAAAARSGRPGAPRSRPGAAPDSGDSRATSSEAVMPTPWTLPPGHEQERLGQRAGARACRGPAQVGVGDEHLGHLGARRPRAARRSGTLR